MQELNVVSDISHHQDHVDFVEARQTLRGLILKATQGVGKTDSVYADRRPMARAAGLLVGSYHFGERAPGRDQAKFYLDQAKPRDDELMALDFETWALNGVPQPPMTLDEAREFVTYIHANTGRWPGLYGGAYLKEQLGRKTEDVLSNCWLWLSQYGPRPVWPKQVWKTWTFWQYTGDGKGPQPRDVPGIGKNVDRDKFIGSSAELEAFWLSGGKTRLSAEMAAHETVFTESLVEEARADAAGGLTAILGETLQKLADVTAGGGRSDSLFFPNGIQFLELDIELPSKLRLTVSGAAKEFAAASAPQPDKAPFAQFKEAPAAQSDDPGSAAGEAPDEREIEAANFGADGKGDFPAGDRGLFVLEAVAIKAISYDIAKSWAFLSACETSSPRVRYKLGAKITPGQKPGVDFQSVDCSGFVRALVRLSTDLGNSFPDGSVVQHDWIRRQGFQQTDWNDGARSDGVVRIAFLSPNATSSGIGHVLIIHNGKTIESHGGVGPDSRPWTDLGFSRKMSVYRLTKGA
ncbi:glycoside hydrolase family 25 protein [Labrys wisconsinensis]|uniref:GH25 family lysozyme M1 (1,4-beta-N-acetylmuramidase) n=1 Tax=Labrys wisconsinensis TaxID=425677 RepID=A0ABU0JDQ6_9HYPH|nr:glycoside hydrolase family 25 protein [Labrys wisconsinensis]MDQ0471750.1 GH25 family lysozyme M1 (1,4-beta-N-acetylmuramidase) [Labrys wisconsinensis]